MDVTVRAARSDDADAIRRVGERGWTAAYSAFLAPETIDAAMAEWYGPADVRAAVERDDRAYFVARRDGAVVGYVGGEPRGEADTATLGALYVDPDHWGEGVGTALLSAFEGACRRRGADALRFHVLSANERGRTFYRARGYEAVAERETDLFGESVSECVFEGRLG